MPTQITRSLFCLLLAFSISVYASPSDRSRKIDRLMTTLHERGQFNASIIVAVGGEAIYRRAFGEANFQTHRKFAAETASNLGSVSKQFTAMTVMVLAEQGKLRYDDAVSKYI